MGVETLLVTAEELARMPAGEQRAELVNGEVVTLAPAGAEHGEMALTIGALLYMFVRQNRLGAAYAAETGFLLRRRCWIILARGRGWCG